MSFISPTPFREALSALRRKVILPTSASSAQLAELPAQIHQLAELSARTTNAAHLQRIKDLTDQLLSGGRHDESGSYIPGSYMDPATMRLSLKESLKSISYDKFAEPGVAGTLRDLSSDPRINLIIRMQTEMMQGLGKFIQSQTVAALDAAPAQELYRLEARKVHRDWPARWDQNGGEFYGNGRMIALKNDPIWVAISDFGLPYPPFAYGSGMWTRDILRPEAEQLGVIDPGAPAPDPAEIPELPKVSSVSDLSEDLRAALLQSMPGAEIIDGILRL